jgi:hypothetical protein
VRSYEYLYEVKATGFIDIDNIGEVCLSATNNFLQEKILVIHTEYGKTKVLQYGPVYVDNVQTPLNAQYTYEEFDYNDRKIDKIIDKFINEPKFSTTQVTEISYEEAIDRIIDFREYL